MTVRLAWPCTKYTKKRSKVDSQFISTSMWLCVDVAVLGSTWRCSRGSVISSSSAWWQFPVVHSSSRERCVNRRSWRTVSTNLLRCVSLSATCVMYTAWYIYFNPEHTTTGEFICIWLLLAVVLLCILPVSIVNCCTLSCLCKIMSKFVFSSLCITLSNTANWLHEA